MNKHASRKQNLLSFPLALGQKLNVAKKSVLYAVATAVLPLCHVCIPEI